MNGSIVAGVDGSDSSKHALRWAAAFAANRKLRLRIVHAVGSAGEPPAPGDVFDIAARDAREILRAAAWTARAVSPALTVTTSARPEPPIPLLLGLSRSVRALVLGSSGRGGFAGMRIGSTANAVASHAHCPAAVIRGPDPRAGDGPVVVGVDGSPDGERAIALAFDEASSKGAPLVAVHAWHEAGGESAWSFVDWDLLAEDERRVLAQRLACWQEKYPDVRVERVVVRDNPRRQLLAWSDKAQLVVTGGRGLGGFRGLRLGSTSHALIQHARCPVLVVRPEAPSPR
ncbi:universal stress protein [Amycolatopsis anabasis]|uniref:universal stress protein n=1 Tax=Amycolatopsis anabasis TaxID=1840409 RepID=UPI00131C8C0D|nr:universal stress protein [Amycolatopsis anabasis]